MPLLGFCTTVRDFLATRLVSRFLPLLSPNLSIVLFTFIGYELLSGLVRLLSPSIFPMVFEQAKNQGGPYALTRLHITWSHHLVSLLNSITISVLAIKCVWEDELKHDRLFGYSEGVARLSALVIGYFLWDLKVTLHYTHIYGPAFLAHAAMGLTGFLASYLPFGMYFTPYYLLFEMSTIFLNMNWFLAKLGLQLETSWLMKTNGMSLLVAYLVFRLWNGVKMTCILYKDLWVAWGRGEFTSITKTGVLIAIGCTLLTNALNYYWFSQLAKQYYTNSTGAQRKKVAKERQDESSDIVVRLEELKDTSPIKHIKPGFMDTFGLDHYQKSYKQS